MIHGADGYQGQLSARIEELKTQLAAKDAEITELKAERAHLLEGFSSKTILRLETQLAGKDAEIARLREAIKAAREPLYDFDWQLAADILDAALNQESK